MTFTLLYDADDKKKMYEGQDETFRTSSYLQELLKKSKENAAM
jgi:hypothetical protein